VLKASVRGVYGCCACGLGTAFSSHSLSLLRSETGESFVICMSSTSILQAARCEAVGIRDQIPRRRFRRKMNAMNTVTAKVPLAISQ